MNRSYVELSLIIFCTFEVLKKSKEQNMTKLKVKILAFKEAKQDYIKKGEERLRNMLPEFADKLEFVNEGAEILFILSGGSESTAAKIAEKNKYYILLSNELDNSNAAAMEIKAWMNREEIASVLLTNPDEMNRFFSSYVEVIEAIDKLKNKNLGLIGNVSDWLIASSIEKQVLKDKLGVNLKCIDWNTLTQFDEAKEDAGFLSRFEYANQSEKENASKIYNILNECIVEEKLDALTVECFPLVRQKSVTACLALSMFNDDNIPAGCEGDLVSIVGMMFAKEVLNSIPWMANVAKINDGSALFAHCTIGKNLLSDYKVTTHFETGLGTAIQGVYRHDEITIFRFNSALNKAFVATGKVFNRPNYATACRTQIEVELPKEKLDSLKTNPLGNHHLIVPGNQVEKLKMACSLLDIELI